VLPAGVVAFLANVVVVVVIFIVLNIIYFATNADMALLWPLYCHSIAQYTIAIAIAIFCFVVSI
jgi:hypothetical protein